MTVLSVADPVRVYQDFAQLDLVSGGRAEIVAGRSAFPEPFAIFGVPISDYDAIFDEKLRLLVQLAAQDRATWSGHYRPALRDVPIVPRALQEPLPIWAGVVGVKTMIGGDDPCPRLQPDVARPDNLSAYTQGRVLDDVVLEMQRLYERDSMD